MDIRYLKYILALAETGNMTRAAEKLYISQPTLSQFLAKQEQELGMPLFHRCGGIFTLTAAGSLYAGYADKVLELTDTLEQDLQNLSNTHRIFVGTSASRAMQMFSSILVDFRKKYPDIELLMTDGSIQINSQLMNEGKIDIAFITADSLEPYKEQSIELKKEEIVLAVSSLSPFCAQPDENMLHGLTNTQVLTYFKDIPFILQHKGSCIRALVDSFFGSQNFTPAIACHISNAQSICDMVASNIGMGFVPIGYARQSPKIRYFSLSPDMYRIHAILYRKDLIMGPPHRYLIELARQYAKTAWQNLS